MSQIGRKLRQRRQNEAALRHARMRDLQIVRFHHGVPIEQNIDVDQPRAFGMRLTRPISRSMRWIRWNSCRGNRSDSTSTT